ncbi:MAG TPA: hypothetical protein VEO94_04770 [Candidatus Dormibacteraeota bacterium]|nr:hypothetical protein [Candidatus Dormibacteraeota bacterium]
MIDAGASLYSITHGTSSRGGHPVLKAKVIRTIIEACGAAESAGGGGGPRSGGRSPAAGGGLAGAPPRARQRKARATLRDPRLGQSPAAARLARRRARRA